MILYHPEKVVFKKVFLLIVLSLGLSCIPCFSVCAAGNSLQIIKEKARKYYWGIGGLKQDHKKAFELYLIAARRGDAEAQFIAGAMYNVGLGVDKSLAKSFPLLHNAALQGKTTAESEMAIAQAYLLGQGVSQDIDLAIDWYTRAAENSSEAQNELGFIYSSGRYVKEDYQKAVGYFTQAAYANHPVSQYNLGVTYYTGKGQDYDLKKSYAWFKIALENGYPNAEKSLKQVAADLTPQEIAEAEGVIDEIMSRMKQ